MRNVILSFVLVFIFYPSFSQTKEDLNKKYPIRTPIQKKITSYENRLLTDLNLSFCDPDSDGMLSIDLLPILDQVQLNAASDIDVNPPKILIGTGAGRILEVDNLLTSPTINLLCDISPVDSFDVAINSSGEFFNTDFSAIQQINEVTCDLTTIDNFGGNAMSFDTQDNLYVNNLSLIESAVYRYDAGFADPPYVWHDFGQGAAGGDFVILGNFMYIAWRNADATEVLFKVTIDANINYVSHEVLGTIRNNTFGLASEQGELYGVTPNEVYRIDLDTPDPSFETIITNDFTYGSWFGAAGFSEAVDLVSTAHASETDAQDNVDPLTSPYTASTGETIHIRTENVSTGDFVVTAVTIDIDSTPIVESNPSDIFACDTDDNGVETFDFSGQSSLILGSQDASLYNIIYSTDSSFATTIPDPSSYENTAPLETIFFRIFNNDNTECFSEGTFSAGVTPSSICSSNLPPEISVSARNPYCPLEQIFIAENFEITDPDDVGINEFSIQISSGYVAGLDLLSLTGSHPAINATWDASQGKLTLSSTGSGDILYTDLIPAVREVVYQSLFDVVSGEKFFSFNIGDANYLPSTDHYYEYVPDDGITWENARIAAENRTYFGLQGYLATVLSADEAALTGEQAAGTGWIGGSDAAVEGEWRWVTGPEAGLVFWNGGISGSTPNFAFWNNNEPNNSGDEDYAHVTDPSIGILGSWNDLPNAGGSGLYVPRGYIVEYGGMPGDPILNISGSTSIYVPVITSTTGGQACPDETVTLSATVDEGEVYWYDAPTGGTLVGTGNTFTTPPLTGPLTFYASASPENCDEADRVAVEATFAQLPIVNDPVELAVCGTDEEGFEVFNLTDANPLISADFANEDFRYFETEADALSDISAIPGPTSYTNMVDTNDQVWVRTTNVNGCFRVSRIDLRVTNTVVRSDYQRTFNECDDFLDADGNDTAANDDTDGITTFNFSDVTAEIRGEFPLTQQPDISVTYYESLANANAATDAITNTSTYRNIFSPGTAQIFVRVENAADASCIYTGVHITLNVDPVPQAVAATDLDICDDDSDGNDTNGFVQSIDLETKTLEILGTQDPSLFTVTYHTSAADATNNASPIASPFTNTIANTQTIYVRVTNNTTQCFTDRSSFNVNVQPLPVVNATVELKQCDDDTDGFAPFNLFESAELISDNFMDETFEFFTSLADAQAGTDAIATPTAYINLVATNDVVWARAITSFNCFRISEVTLTVATNSSQVTTFPPRSYNTCDDFLDVNGDDTINNDDTDGISRFNFDDFTDDIIDAFPISEQPFLTVEYYRNEADALSELNAIEDPENYRNIGFPNTQQIYVRVDNNQNNECIGYVPLITLIVDPVPVANPVADLQDCDNADDGDPNNGFIQSFDLESRTADILGAQDPATYTVTYHTTPEDATLGVNEIVNTSSYTNTTAYQQTIYIRVTHNTQGCFIDRASFDIIVNPLPEANFVEDLEVCDDGTGGSAQNGFSSNFDLELQTPGILGSQDPANFTVTYHRSLAHAQGGIAPITGLYANTEAFSQIIYVRVSNNTTLCANAISNFNIIVNSEPTAVDIGPLPLCDNDFDGDDTNGIIQNIDLNAQIPNILGPDQDEDDFTVTFHETPEDAELGMNPLSSPYENTTADLQPIYVRVTNNDTQCFNDDLMFEIRINPLPDFTVTSPQIVCLNGPELTLSVENPAAIYDYVWTDPEGNELIGSQITITTGGIYSVTATITTGSGCQRTREIRVDESIIATFTEADITIVDDSDNNSITVDPTNLGIGDYEYALEDENGQIFRDYQDDPMFNNIPGGFYTVLVRDKNGCGEVSVDVSVVEFPKFFTPNNDGINDTWAIKGVNSTFFPNSEINIFNRFGKVVAQIAIDNPGWDGTFNGKTLPSDDYWFNIRLVDRDGNVRQRQGNFSLLRREN